MGNKKIERISPVSSTGNRFIAAEISGVKAVHTEIADGSYKSVFKFSHSIAAAGAALATGQQIMDLEKCHLNVERGIVDISMLPDGATTDTVEVGIGTLIGSGANDALSDVGATAEDILDGTDCTILAGAAAKASYIEFVGETDAKDGTSTAKDVFFNTADTYAATAGIVCTVVITLWWHATD